MKKIVLVCGLIAGLICVAWPVASMAVNEKHIDFDKGMIYGYATMLLAFSLIFVGTKRYRDRYNGGVISFGKAFRIGLYITLIASTCYVVIWLIDYFYFIPDFADQYAKYLLDKMKASGATQVAIANKAAELASFNELYQNPFFNALITYCEIIPVGLVVSLISALILKRKRVVG
jgi:hypothetical protein